MYCNKNLVYVLKLTVVCLAFCIAIFILSVVGNKVFDNSTKAVFENVQLPYIIIDAGHGGRDGGASSNNGILEKDLNLLIANTMFDIFNVCGIQTIMTRTEDSLVCDETDIALKGKYKLTDLNNRLEVSKKNPQAIFVSIHMNKFSVEKYKGLQVYYSSNNDFSFEIAQNIQSTVAQLLQMENTRKVKKAGSNIFILDRITAPAVLVECGFLSNEEEAEKLSSCVYRTKLSMVISKSLVLNLTKNRNN